MRAAEANTGLMGAEPRVIAEDPTDDLHDCIEDAIIMSRDSGRSFNWGNRTWLIIQGNITKRPKSDEVRIVTFESCQQLQTARCVYTNKIYF